MRFQMSLRWKSYVAPKPPKRDSKPQNGRFPSKTHFAWRKSATKFLCVKTVSDKVVRHSFAYLCVRKLLVGDVPFYVKIAKRRLPKIAYVIPGDRPIWKSCRVWIRKREVGLPPIESENLTSTPQ